MEALGRRRGVLEDEVLEAMIFVEEGQAELDSAQESLDKIESTWQKSQSSLKEEQNELAIALHGLIAEREAYAGRIDAPLREEYESIRARTHGVAVVGFANNACLGCHVTVSANKALQAERGERVTCTGCGRIMVRL